MAKDSLPKPPAPRDARTAYLMTFFTDEDHSLHFATSRDGYSFTDVNGGKPVMDGREAAEQKGIRDPHIMRGPDGGFYMSMTDLHIFAKREGLRDTSGSGPRSNIAGQQPQHDLHEVLRPDPLVTVAGHAIGPVHALSDAGNMWAPETIYDPQRKRLMVYFTTRDGNGPNYLVYSYADNDFSTLTEEPKKLFDYPDPKVNVIDADITRSAANITCSMSASGTRQYPPFGVVADQQRLDEGPAQGRSRNRRDGGADIVAAQWHQHLCPDVRCVRYQPQQYGFFRNHGLRDLPEYRSLQRAWITDEGDQLHSPKHGAVVAISPAEATRLERYFAAR